MLLEHAIINFEDMRGHQQLLAINVHISFIINYFPNIFRMMHTQTLTKAH